jgi:hypothetical protein
MSSKTKSKIRSKRGDKQVSKDIKKKTHENTSAAFRIKPLGGSRVTIRYKGIIMETERLGDEIVELDEPIHSDCELVGKHAIPINEIGSYDMLGRLYRANIFGDYIVLESNYPVMFLTVEYSRSFVSGSLLQIYLSMRMDQDQKIAINKTKKYETYKDLKFSGTWNLSIECDPEMKELWKDKITECIKKDVLQEFHYDYEENKEKQLMKPEDVVELINNNINTQLKWYEDIMTETAFNFVTVKRARNYFVTLAQDPRLHKLLKVAMDCRILNRRAEQEMDDEEYVPPDHDKVVRLDVIRQKMIDDGELILSSDSE